MAIGRNPELSEEMQESFCNCIRMGMSINGACRYVGIDRQTFYNYKNKSKDTTLENYEIYKSFIDKYKKAAGAAELKLLADIQNDQSWQSKAWILERRHPEDWARDRKTEDDNKSINVNFSIKDLAKPDGD